MFFGLRRRIGRKQWRLGNLALMIAFGAASVLVAVSVGIRIPPEVLEVPYEYDLGRWAALH
jgi:hypothetical protein